MNHLEAIVERLYRRAGHSSHEDFKHAAALLVNGKVAVIGINDVLQHAELVVLKRAGRYGYPLRGSTLLVVRRTPGGRLALSKPCARCQRVLDKLGLKVLYTGRDGTLQRVLSDVN